MAIFVIVQCLWNLINVNLFITCSHDRVTFGKRRIFTSDVSFCSFSLWEKVKDGNMENMRQVFREQRSKER